MEDVPPGFRFYPTEEELVSFYLYNKLEGIGPDLERVIPIVDIYELDPWQLPQVSGELCHGDPEQWFFFSPRQEREARGGRPNRTTNSGYWKATGSPGLVYSSGNRIIGLKKTMVFYKGKAPTGTKTKWKMNEYRATQGEATSSSSAAPLVRTKKEIKYYTQRLQILCKQIVYNRLRNPFMSTHLRHEFSLCRVYVKSGCLRAFDRRPVGARTSEAPMQQGHVDRGTTSHRNISSSLEKLSSPDTSSSGDQAHDDSTQLGESVDWKMTNEFNPLWEWEQLNWF